LVADVQFDGLNYNIMQTATLGGRPERDISPDFEGYAKVQRTKRMASSSRASLADDALLAGPLQYQDFSGRPGKIFGTADLGILEAMGRQARPVTCLEGDQDVDLALELLRGQGW
jgi:hypothetical protein